MQIYFTTSQSQEVLQQAASAAIVVLLVLVLALNALAIFIRNKFQPGVVTTMTKRSGDLQSAQHSERKSGQLHGAASSTSHARAGRSLPDRAGHARHARPATSTCSTTTSTPSTTSTSTFGRHEITALIGPSGCGKSTVLRSLNRMNDLVTGCRVEGQVTYHDVDIYGP